MSERLQRAAKALRVHGLAVGVIALLAVVGLFAVRWIAASHDAPPPRKAMQFTMVKVQPPPPPPPKAPEPPPPTEQKPMDEPQANRVEFKMTDLPPPDAKPPGGPAAGPLAMATEGSGPGDAFNLAGNPGGRALTSGGGGGDGQGVGDGTGNRFAWYYTRLAAEIEDAFRRQRLIEKASVRVELRIWAEQDGRITRVELMHSTGDARVDEAIRSIAGMRLREPPPGDVPMPMIARLTARRPK